MIEIQIFNREPFKRETRCVHCSQSEERHGGEGRQPKQCVSGGPARFFDTLNLPEGKTCGDCVHIRRCNAMFGHMPPDETCDWYPIRFYLKEQTQA